MNCRYYLLKDVSLNNWDNIFFSKDATSKFILVSLKDDNSIFLHLSLAFGYRYRYKLWGNVFQKILVQFSSYHLLERYNHICHSFVFWKMLPPFLVYDLFRKIKPISIPVIWSVLSLGKLHYLCARGAANLKSFWKLTRKPQKWVSIGPVDNFWHRVVRFANENFFSAPPKSQRDIFLPPLIALYVPSIIPLV